MLVEGIQGTDGHGIQDGSLKRGEMYWSRWIRYYRWIRIPDPRGEMCWFWSTDGHGSGRILEAKWFQIRGTGDTDPGDLDLGAKCTGFGLKAQFVGFTHLCMRNV